MKNIETKQYKPFKPVVKVFYNGKDTGNDFSDYLREVTFREYEDDQSDEISFTMNNQDGYFTNLWYPKKGDKLSTSVDFGNITFNLGTMTIDENIFQFGTSGDTVEIKALATSANVPVRSNKTRNFTGKTLVEIANEMGKTHGFKVIGDTGFVKVGAVVQKNESDLAFLKRISKLYGYIFNIKDGLLTFTSLQEMEDNETLLTLSLSSDIESLNLRDTVTKIYGKCTVKYLDLKSKTVKSYTAQGNTSILDTLTLDKRCNSLDEAKRVAQAALKNSNREITGNISLSKPKENFMSGVNFDLIGASNFEGKYHIKSHTLKINADGLKQEGEIQKC